jgi:sulfur-oxidizing protein SoxX
MTINMKDLKSVALASLLLTLAACGKSGQAPEDAPEAQAAAAPAVSPEAAFETALESSFRAKGQAGMDRIHRSEMQKECSRLDPPPADVAKKIMDEAMANVKFPADGNFMGDWQKGKQIANIGTGMQHSDDPAVPNGGNCYACHELDPGEPGYGTLGPSLKAYGKLRGNSEEIVKYTWTRLYNSMAYNACSYMPRFGEAQILTEEQMKDVMAFLLDPASPVNQ